MRVFLCGIFLFLAIFQGALLARSSANADSAFYVVGCAIFCTCFAVNLEIWLLQLRRTIRDEDRPTTRKP